MGNLTGSGLSSMQQTRLSLYSRASAGNAHTTTLAVSPSSAYSGMLDVLSKVE